MERRMQGQLIAWSPQTHPALILGRLVDRSDLILFITIKQAECFSESPQHLITIN